MSQLIVDLASLQRKLGDATYQRARETYLLQRVLPGFEFTRPDGGSVRATGLVGGSHRERYEVEVEAEIDEAGVVLSLWGTCECAAAKPCKHMGALMMKAAYSQGAVRASSAQPESARTPAQPRLAPLEASFERDLLNWLDTHDASQTDAKPEESRSPEPSRDQAVFVMAQRKWGERQQLELRCMWSKALKRGGWSKPREMNSVDPSLHPPDVADAMRLILALPRSTSTWNYSSGARGVVTGNTGLLALRRASATGMLFGLSETEHLIGPYTQASAARLAWEWIESQAFAGTWYLVPTLPEHPQARLQRDGVLAWWDESACIWGEVDPGDFSAQRLQALLQFPPLVETSWQRHEAALMRQLAGLPLPPIAKPTPTVRLGAPQALLRVEPIPTFERASVGVAAAVLVFDYQNAEGAQALSAAQRKELEGPFTHVPSPMLLTEETGDAATRVLVYRDTAFERDARRRLEALGLIGERNGRWRSKPGLSTEAQPWLHWAEDGFAAFKEAGFEVDDRALNNWVTRADALRVDLDAQDPNDEAVSQWFDLSLGIEVNGLRVNVLPVLPALIAAMDRAQVPEYVFLPHPDDAENRWLRVASAQISPWVQTLMDLVGANAQGEAIRLSAFEALRMGADLGAGVAWAGAARLREMLDALRQSACGGSLPRVDLPKGLQAELRPYQRDGLNWLQFLRANRLGGILADDMGLGKTLQALAHLVVEKELGRLHQPALIICPVSVLGNWRREISRFAPTLRFALVHGNDRHTQQLDWKALDVVIAPYSLLHRDRERWLGTSFSVLVLDEAQNIKNAATQAAQVTQELRADQRVCLSGTPLENHLGELWSLFHTVMPGFLGSQADFKTNFRTPIEQHGSSEHMERLRRRVTPFILRRSKREVALDLPEKIETLQTVALTGKQADLYETIRLSTEKSVREAIAAKGAARSQIEVLDALLKLRQVCCDPRLVPTQKGKPVLQSAKLERLMELLPELVEEGRRVLLFSQFTSMLELIEEALAKAGLTWVKLTGQSKYRDALIERFTSGEVPIFLISLKAGGVGLNLQQADTVIHYDPWWNPAAENQATDRAHRIGQTEQVLVYKLVAEGTIEERMLALQQRKAALAEGVLSGAAARKEALFTESDLHELLRPIAE